MGRSLKRFSWLALLALTSCRDKPSPPSAPSATVAPTNVAPRPALGFEARSSASFALVAAEDGAVLAAGTPRTGLSVSFLDSRGQPRGAPLVVAGSEKHAVLEVAGASSGSQVGFAWTERSESATTAHGVLGDSKTRSFAALLPLGEASVGATEAGGRHIAFSISDKAEAMVLMRVRDEPCADAPDRSCAAFRFRELLSTGPELRGLPMSVPLPCSGGLAGFTLVGERSHYAFCSEQNGTPRVTAFMRQLSPFYVGVKSLASGCAPQGALRLGDDAVFVLDCASGRRGVRIGGLDSDERPLDVGQATVSCELGRPRLRVPGQPPLSFDLGPPFEGLGPLLPERFGKALHAVWTGSSLLVAEWRAGQVAVRAYECRGGELAE